MKWNIVTDSSCDLLPMSKQDGEIQMKRWKIAATVTGSLVLLGGLIGSILVVYKKSHTNKNQEESNDEQYYHNS